MLRIIQMSKKLEIFSNSLSLVYSLLVQKDAVEYKAKKPTNHSCCGPPPWRVVTFIRLRRRVPRSVCRRYHVAPVAEL